MRPAQFARRNGPSREQESGSHRSPVQQLARFLQVAGSVDDLARRIAEETKARYGRGELPEIDTASEIPALIQGTVNAESPAWRRLDTLIRRRLNL
ncbi:hypothetical protein [Streptomyces sp. NPDC008122]|uniref:hypothetical protein n=1 Tax=Streptomyces sp. NPDC008122 TaxID=3364810 RepID=UPI0036E59BD8